MCRFLPSKLFEKCHGGLDPFVLWIQIVSTDESKILIDDFLFKITFHKLVPKGKYASFALWSEVVIAICLLSISLFQFFFQYVLGDFQDHILSGYFAYIGSLRAWVSLIKGILL